MALFEVDDLHKSYRGAGKKVVRAVDGVSFGLDRHEMLAVVGESGCGKTTLVQAALQLTDATSGSVRFAGDDISAYRPRQLRPLRKSMQIVYQDPYESLDPRYKVGQTVEEPLLIHGIGQSREERRRLVVEALEKAELTPADLYVNRYPHELSGGQRQRVAIAAALVTDPQLLVADEPVSMLDVSVRAGIMNLLRRLCTDSGMAVLMITHDLAVAAHFADRIAVMYLGRIVEIGPARDVVRSPQHPYTKALLGVAPKRNAGVRKGKQQLLGGEPGDAAAIPAGCRFQPRCPVAVERCASIDPQLAPAGADRALHEAACVLVDLLEDKEIA